MSADLIGETMGHCCVKAAVANDEGENEDPPLLGNANANNGGEQDSLYPDDDQLNNAENDLPSGACSIGGAAATGHEGDLSEEELERYMTHHFDFESVGDHEAEFEVTKVICAYNKIIDKLNSLRQSCEELRNYQISGSRRPREVSLQMAMSDFSLELENYKLHLRVQRYDTDGLTICYDERNIQIDKVRNNMRTVTATCGFVNWLKGACSGETLDLVQIANNILGLASGEEGLERKVLENDKCTQEERQNYYATMRFIRCIPTQLWPRLQRTIETETAEFRESLTPILELEESDTE